MKLRYRFLLISVGLIIFLIVGPLLVLFARGYKVDFEKRQIFKTGTLIVRSEPSRADILLDGEIMDDTTPATVRFLLPKDYNISIKKDGYQTWTKRLGINSELVTWANIGRDYVTLFLQEPKTLSTTAVKAIMINPSFSRLLFVQNNQLKFLDAANGRIDVIGSTNFWLELQNSNINPEISNLFYALSANRTLPLTNEELGLPLKFQTSQDWLVALQNGFLTAWNRDNVIVKEVESVRDFDLAGNTLWFVDGINLVRLDLGNNQAAIVQTNIPLSSKTLIVTGPNKLFLILDTALYVVNDNLEKIYDNVTFAHWQNNSSNLVYGNPHEIFLFNTNAIQSSLILRSTTAISQQIANTETGYIIFANEGKIKAIEIDGRDHRNVYTLTDAMDGFMVSDDGKKLFLFDQTQIKTVEIR